MQIIYQTCGILRQLYSHHAEENNSLHSYRLKKQSNLIVKSINIKTEFLQQIIYQTCGILRQLYSHHAEENNSLHSYRLKKQSNLIVKSINIKTECK